MNKNILITGSNGFIGNSIFESIKNLGFNVYGIDYSNSNISNKFKIDLLNIDDLIKNKVKFPKFDVIIHTAAIAHFKSINQSKKIIDINFKMTSNLIDSEIINKKTHMIFLSSISVYGEDGRKTFVKVNDELNPSTLYGVSKKKCEEYLLSRFKKIDILRLCPVYSKKNLKDIQKRINFPFFNKIKLKVYPSPIFSFCHLENISKIILDILRNKRQQSQRIFNISDKTTYKQNDLLVNVKYPVILPEKLFRIFYMFTFIINLNAMHKIRCIYWKFFRNNIYKNNYQLKADLKENLLDYISNN